MSSSSRRATAASISTRRNAAASGPPASVSAAGTAENEVDPSDARQLLGAGDEERRPDLLGPRQAAAHLPSEDDEIGRRRPRQPPRRRTIERDERDHQLGARAAQPGDLALGGRHRILRLRTDPRRERRVRHAEDPHPHVADRLRAPTERWPATWKSSPPAGAARPRRVRAPMSFSASPAANGPSA